MKIIINAGHGGNDAGAVYKNFKERDINLAVAKEVVKQLRAVGMDAVLITQDGIRLDSVDDIAREAIRLNGNLLVSIHHNAGGGIGYEIIHPISKGKSFELAGYIAEEFRKIGQVPHGTGFLARASEKNPKLDYYGVIRGAVEKMPVVIGEFGYIDNPIDLKKFDTPEKQKLEATAYAKAIIRFVQKLIREQKIAQSKIFYEGVVNTAKLNIRSTPEIKSNNKIGEYTEGDRLEIVDAQGEWFKTDKGWVNRKYVTITNKIKDRR